MPQRKSALKKLHQDKKRALRNLAIKTTLKKTIKKFHRAIAAKQAAEAKAALAEVLSKLDKARQVNIIHRNTVARKKSQFMRAFNKLS